MPSCSSGDSLQRSSRNVNHIVGRAVESCQFRLLPPVLQGFQAQLIQHVSDTAASIIVTHDETGGPSLDGFDSR